MIIPKKINFFLIIATLFLMSCTTTGDKTDPNDAAMTSSPDLLAPTENPEELVMQGKANEAAKLYLSMAGRASAPDRQRFLLRGTHLLIGLKSFETANKILSGMNTAELTGEQLIHFAYLNARISVNSRNAESGKLWLAYLKDKNYLNFTTHIDALKLMIAVYQLANDNRSATVTRIQLEPSLSLEPEIISVQQAIIRGLLLLSKEELNDISKNETLSNSGTWLELAMLVKKSKNPFRLGSQLASWKELNPDSTIRDEIIASLAPQNFDEKLQIENVALLLPLSGPFKKPALAIRDGFLANYYAEDPSIKKPTIRVYNTAGNMRSILKIYNQAMEDGADIIVGPLRKKSIEALTKSSNLDTPTLVLNQLEDKNFYTKNFYQFALSPEQEAKQTALRAWQDGHNRAAIIYPDNKWGMRVVSAFKKKWLELGGEIVAENDYKAKKNDFSKPIKALLSIDKSYERKRELAKLLRTKLRFEPRRRQDIDFIFMATFPRQARLIPPQLKFFHAEKLPIYSTSHSFSGKINRKKDRDLNSVIVGDMPWTLTNTKNNNTKLQIYRTWPNKSKQFNRFYAFGNDAYYVLNYLSWLRGNSQSRLEGETGNLHMNESNQILRELSWAKFKNGKPLLLPVTAKITN